MSAKILIIRGGAIGDFILTLPALAALRAQFPKAHLEVLGYPHIVQLAVVGGLADKVMSIEARALAGFFARSGELDKGLAEYFGGFNLIISYLFDPDKIFQTNVALCSKAQFIAGPHRPDEKTGLHATEVFLQPLKQLAIFDADPIPRLAVGTGQASECGSRNADQETRDFNGLASHAASAWLACHPGSGSESKNWPEGKWAELLERLARTSDLNFLLIGGEAEGDRLNRLASGLPQHRIEIAQNLPLVEVAIRLRECRIYLGHDSGISHLAAAVGLEGLVLWGSTELAVWGPRGGKLRVLRETQALPDLPVERVFRELTEEVRGSNWPPSPG